VRPASGSGRVPEFMLGVICAVLLIAFGIYLAETLRD
jgi:hypothetical protein